jgi:hypothetical protein
MFKNSSLIFYFRASAARTSRVARWQANRYVIMFHLNKLFIEINQPLIFLLNLLCLYKNHIVVMVAYFYAIEDSKENN